MVINLRGPSGSGKSTAVRTLIERCGGEFMPEVKGERLAGYLLPENVWVIGRYNIQSGGCDSYSRKGALDMISEEIVRCAATYSHVVFEGLLVSDVLGRWLEVKQRLPANQEWIWAFLDTPPEECLRRIYVRNGGKPINEQNVANKSLRRFQQQRRLEALGEPYVLVPHESAYEWLHSRLYPQSATEDLYNQWEAANLQ